MDRVDFTSKITQLLNEMDKAGDKPIIDYVMRHAIEQVFFYLTDKSKLDGITKKSAHQYGKSMDIYFINDKGEMDMSPERYIKWHKVWNEKYGGNIMISWDLPHFQLD